MFHRIGAFALAGMMALTMATPAMAVTEEQDFICGIEEHTHELGTCYESMTCTNDEAGHVHDATCYVNLTCETPEHKHDDTCRKTDPVTGPADDQNKPNLTITGALAGVRYDVYPLLTLTGQTDKYYEYKLATDDDGNLTDAAKAVQGVINKFLANDNKGYGFELVDGNRVVFWAKATGSETMEDAYNTWKDTADGKLFLTRFADTVKDAAENGITVGEETKTLGNAVASVKDNDGVNDLNTDAGTIEIDLDVGYYLVISSAGQRAMISTQGNEGAEIIEKNKAPELEKTVGEFANGEFKPNNDAAVDDFVSFRVVIETRNGVNHLKFLDTLSEGLTFEQLTSVRFVPLKAGAGKADIEFDSNGYPTAESMDKIREVYSKSVPTEGNNLNETDKGVVNLWVSGENDNEMVKVTLPDKTTNMSNIEIEFKSQWLNSMRSTAEADMTDKNATFDQPAMTSKDTNRMATWGADAEGKPTYGTAALYNMYLGDVSDPTDDGGLILIEYEAQLNEKAVIGGTGNTNKAKLEYGNDPTTDSGKLTVETPPTHTYTYQLDVHKYEKGNDSKPLAGAKFDLYRLNNVEDGEPAGVTEIGTDANSLVKFVPATGEGETAVPARVEVNSGLIVDKIEGDFKNVNGDKNQFTRIATDLMTGDDGMTKMERLDAGLYALVETEAPDGYIKAEKPIYVVIGGVHTNSATVNDSNAVDANTYVQTSIGANTFELSKDVDSTSVTNERVAVENASGLVMPTTGGIGTTIFYIVGGLLVIGAGVLLVLKKREGGQQE